MQKKCGACGQNFEAKRTTAKYCSNRCRQRAFQSPAGKASKAKPAALGVVAGDGRSTRPRGPGPLERATRKKLQAAGALQTPAGEAALMLAARLHRVGDHESGAGYASLMREYRAVMADALSRPPETGKKDALALIQEQAALKLIQGGRR